MNTCDKHYRPSFSSTHLPQCFWHFKMFLPFSLPLSIALKWFLETYKKYQLKFIDRNPVYHVIIATESNQEAWGPWTSPHKTFNNATPPSDVRCKSQNFENYSLQSFYMQIIWYEERKLIFAREMNLFKFVKSQYWPQLPIKWLVV